MNISKIKINNLQCQLAVNTVTLLGRVGNEPQKRGNDEHPVVTFSVATHNNYKWVIHSHFVMELFIVFFFDK